MNCSLQPIFWAASCRPLVTLTCDGGHELQAAQKAMVFMKMKFNFISLLLFSLVFLRPTLRAQTPERGIQDNSFLIEEAYNKEYGVVQHISTSTYFPESDDWAYSFTQEWPVPGVRHQLSYTLNTVRP